MCRKHAYGQSKELHLKFDSYRLHSLGRDRGNLRVDEASGTNSLSHPYTKPRQY